MSNRIIRHSSRYKGPAGDSRPAAEIFAEMEKRNEQANKAIKKMIVSLNETLASMTLGAHDSAVEAIKNAFIDWWLEHDIEARQRYEEGIGLDQHSETVELLAEIAVLKNERDKYKAFSDMISQLNNCNNCSGKKTCRCAPKLGTSVRYNCHMWKGTEDI